MRNVETPRTLAELDGINEEHLAVRRIRAREANGWPYRLWTAREFHAWAVADREASRERTEDVRRRHSRTHAS